MAKSFVRAPYVSGEWFKPAASTNMRSEIWAEFKEVDGISYRISRIRTTSPTKKTSYSTRLQVGDKSCPLNEPSQQEHAKWCLDQWIRVFQKFYQEFSDKIVVAPRTTRTPEELAKYIYTKGKK